MNTRDRLYAAAMERGLRRSTVLSYQVLMNRLGVLDMDPTREEVMAAIWSIDNPNSRRAAVIAVRSIFQWDSKIPKPVPRRYVLPGTFDFTSFYGTAVTALTLYTSAFVCEALRSGINAVPLGQAEAARAIGLPFTGVMTRVVLPQAFRASVPPLASVQIALIKNTSVAAIFGVAEAVATMRVTTNNFSSQRLGIFIAFALGYIVIVEAFSFLSHRLERRWRIA